MINLQFNGIPDRTRLFLELIPCLAMSQRGSSSQSPEPFRILTMMGLKTTSCS